MLRLSYETFGTEILEGSWAQRTIFFLCAVGAVLFGIFSVREKEWKKRLIFVSLGNLCCSIFGIMLLSGLGFVGGTMCMLFHGILFTCAFFNAGIAASLTGKTKVDEMDGVGKQIPWVFACFTITALSIMGLPGPYGFLREVVSWGGGCLQGGFSWQPGNSAFIYERDPCSGEPAAAGASGVFSHRGVREAYKYRQ